MKTTLNLFGALCLGTLTGLAQQPSTPEATPVSSGAQAPKPAAAPTAVVVPATPAPAAANPNDPPVAKAQPVNDREVMTQLQIFLDQQNFGPGKIDGSGKLFTAQALDRYRQAHGLPQNGQIDADIPLDSVYPVYTTYEIKAGDLKYVGEVPAKPAEQAKKKWMPYPSLSQFIGERYHSDPDFLAKLNPTLKMDNLKPGDVVRVPNVEPFKVEDLADAQLPANPEFVKRLITVDTKNRMLDVTEGDKLLASFPITPGSTTLPAPKGTWKILGIHELPNFRHDEAMLNHGYRSSNFNMIPPGPRNPVGIMWMGLNKPGIGIHGTNSPWNIGRSGSHGCIRVANWDVIRLSAMVTEGMKVIIK